MLILTDSPAYICLSYLFNEYGFNESDLQGKYIYFSKDSLPPIQLNSLKVNYSELELSSYAIQVGESVDKFISKFTWAMKTLEAFSKKS